MFREFPFIGLLILFLLTPPMHAESQKPAAEESNKEQKSEADKKPVKEIKPAVPTVVDLTLHPAKLPCPTRKYRLTTPYLDQTPGNAACLYYRAALTANYEQGLARNAKNDPKTGVVNLRTQRDTIEKGLKTDLADLPRDAIKATLKLYRHSFHQMEMAARRTVCDWGYPLRESESITGIRLVELDATRIVTEALLLRARMEMADGDVQKSVDTLRTVLATAIHVGRSQLLVNKGWGRSVIRKVADQCETLVQVPNVPNLYWTFTTLPQPCINQHNGIEMEEAFPELATPSLREARRRQLSNAEASVFLTRFIAEVRKEFLHYSYHEVSTAEAKDIRRWFGSVSPGNYVKETYPKALAKLTETGHADSELENMPEAQIVLLYIATVYDELRDSLLQWSYVPYWQSRSGVAAAQKAFKATVENDPLLLAFMATTSVCSRNDWLWYGPAETERRLATLRVIEAIRLFAANHEGRLPKALDEITAVPIPINPVTGKPFPYKLEGDTAVLTADGGPAYRIAEQREYRIKLADDCSRSQVLKQ